MSIPAIHLYPGSFEDKSEEEDDDGLSDYYYLQLQEVAFHSAFEAEVHNVAGFPNRFHTFRYKTIIRDENKNSFIEHFSMQLTRQEIAALLDIGRNYEQEIEKEFVRTPDNAIVIQDFMSFKVLAVSEATSKTLRSLLQKTDRQME